MRTAKRFVARLPARKRRILLILLVVMGTGMLASAGTLA